MECDLHVFQRDATPPRKVAIKIVLAESLPAKFINVLKEEGDAVAQFEQDNFVTVHECGIIDDHYYLVKHGSNGPPTGIRTAALGPDCRESSRIWSVNKPSVKGRCLANYGHSAISEMCF